MHRYSIQKIVAMLVIAITVLSSGSGIQFRNEVLKPLEEIFSAVTILSAGYEENDDNTDTKPPKSSFVDYAAICSPHGVSEFVPSTIHHAASEPFRFIPEVYIDIIVPPHLA